MIDLLLLGLPLVIAIVTATRVGSQVANARALASRVMVAQYAFAGLERVLGGKAQLSDDGSLRVQVEGMFLHVRLVGAHTSGAHFRCVLGLLPGAVVVRAASMMTPFTGGRPLDDQHATGDESFDRAVWIDGPEPETVSHLNAPTRAAIRMLVAEGASLELGHWTVTAPGPRGEGDGSLAGLERSARLLLAAGRPWVVMKPASERLTDLVLNDPLPKVRARALLRLFHKPWSAKNPFPEVARTVVGGDLVAALASPAPDVVVAAALLLRLDGTATAVPALREAAGRMAASPERDALEDAILAIQSRVGADSVGALSLGVSAGELSAAVEVGELAPAERPGELGRPG